MKSYQMLFFKITNSLFFLLTLGNQLCNYVIVETGIREKGEKHENLSIRN